MLTYIVGCGYVGVPTAAYFLEKGIRVQLVELDEVKREKLLKGASPIDEPGVDYVLARATDYDVVEHVTVPEHQDDCHDCRNSDCIHFVFLCVGTPTGGGEFGYAADLNVLEAAAKDASDRLKAASVSSAVLIIRSTVPPGTARRIEDLTGWPVVSNPEFLREGTALDDLRQQTRVVLGGNSVYVEEVRKRFYPNLACLRMTNESAELAKYAVNTMLGVRLTVMNELADICEDLTEARIGDIRAVLSTDERIGSAFLAPGPGAGGPCLPKDMHALAWAATREVESKNPDMRMFRVPGAITMAARSNTDRMKAYLYDRLVKHLGVPLQAATIGVWGLAFKSGTDDIRSSPATELIWRLVRAGARVRCHDPNCQARTNMVVDRVKFAGVFSESIAVCPTPLEAAAEVDALVIATEWPDYYSPGLLKAAAEWMHGDLLIDGRGMYRGHEVRAAGLVPAIIGEPFKGETGR